MRRPRTSPRTGAVRTTSEREQGALGVMNQSGEQPRVGPARGLSLPPPILQRRARHQRHDALPSTPRAPHPAREDPRTPRRLPGRHRLLRAALRGRRAAVRARLARKPRGLARLRRRAGRRGLVGCGGTRTLGRRLAHAHGPRRGLHLQHQPADERSAQHGRSLKGQSAGGAARSKTRPTKVRSEQRQAGFIVAREGARGGTEGLC